MLFCDNLLLKLKNKEASGDASLFKARRESRRNSPPFQAL